MNWIISCTSKELKTLTSKTPAFSIQEEKSAIVISTLFCAVMHWIILTSIQNSKHLSEKFMATSRATLPVTDGYYFCDVLYKSLINKLLDQLPFTNRFCMKYKIYDFLLADSGYLATAVWVPEKNQNVSNQGKNSEKCFLIQDAQKVWKPVCW